MAETIFSENNQSMRIVHILKVNGLAGVERHLLTLLPALQARDVDPEVLLLAPPDSPADAIGEAFRAAGIPAQKLPMSGRPSPGLVRRLARRLGRARPDLVHTHSRQAERYGALAARWAGVPHMISTRYLETPPTWAERQLDRWLRGRINHRIAIDPEVQAQTARADGLRPEQVSLIGYGLAEDRLRIGGGARAVLCAEFGISPQGAPLVGLICNLDEPGDSGLLGLQAFWHVSVRHPDAHLLIAGDGARRPFLEQQARGYNLSGHVHFLGWRADLPTITAVVDVLMVPLPLAGAGLAMLEAIALETPVIASQDAALPDLLETGQTGLVVEAGSIDLLTGSLSLLLEDSELRAKLAANAKARLGNGYRVDRVADQTLAVYQRVLAR